MTRVKVSVEDLLADGGDWEAFGNLSGEEVMVLAESEPDTLPKRLRQICSSLSVLLVLIIQLTFIIL